MKKLNMDFSQKIVVNSNESAWAESESGIRYLPLEFDPRENGRSSSVIHLKKGQVFEGLQSGSAKEFFVLSGELVSDSENFGPGSYVRTSSKNAIKAKSDAIVFLKENTGVVESAGVYSVNTMNEEWRPGHGNLQVMPLHNEGTDSAALVLWPEGERFTPHRHWGGEEIFVLSGEFIDEHGRYPAGTWIRSPHLSAHFPYVEKETVILVKVGHLA